MVQFIKSLVSRKCEIIWQQNSRRKMLPRLSLSLSLSLCVCVCLGEREAVISPSPALIESRCWCRPGQERKSFRKVLRAQPGLSGPRPGQPITAQQRLILGVKWELLLAWDSNVGVRSRCPGKVSESKPTHSKRKVKTFACSTGQWPKPVLIQLNMPSLSFSLSFPLCVSACVFVFEFCIEW